MSVLLMSCKNSTRVKLNPAAVNVAPNTVQEQYRVAAEKASRCFRLARTIVDPVMVRLLKEMGEDYLREAERLLR